MSVRAPGGRSSSFITGALVSTGRAARLTFLLRLLHARIDEVGDDEDVEEDEVELAAAEEDEVAEDEEVEEAEDEETVEEEVDATEDEAEVDEDNEGEEAEVAANEVVLLELLLNATDDDDDLKLDVEEVVGLTETELVVGLTESELVVGLREDELVLGLTEEEVLLSEGVSVLFGEFDVDEAAAEGDEIAADDCGEGNDDVVEEKAASEAVEDDETVRDDEVDGRMREDEDDEDNDNESGEPALDDAEVAAAVKLTLEVLDDETPSTLLLLATDELLRTVLLDEAELAAATADVPKLELDRELDDGRLIDKGSAICEEVGAAGMDMLTGLEDKRATDEVVEDGFTDEVVEDGFEEVDATFDEVLLVNLTEEDEVVVGFCAFVRIMVAQDLVNMHYLGA
jgi:hypothetical protein